MVTAGWSTIVTAASIVLRVLLVSFAIGTIFPAFRRCAPQVSTSEGYAYGSGAGYTIREFLARRTFKSRQGVAIDRQLTPVVPCPSTSLPIRRRNRARIGAHPNRSLFEGEVVVPSISVPSGAARSAAARGNTGREMACAPVQQRMTEHRHHRLGNAYASSSTPEPDPSRIRACVDATRRTIDSSASSGTVASGCARACRTAAERTSGDTPDVDHVDLDGIFRLTAYAKAPASLVASAFRRKIAAASSPQISISSDLRDRAGNNRRPARIGDGTSALGFPLTIGGKPPRGPGGVAILRDEIVAAQAERAAGIERKGVRIPPDDVIPGSAIRLAVVQTSRMAP